MPKGPLELAAKQTSERAKSKGFWRRPRTNRPHLHSPYSGLTYFPKNRSGRSPYTKAWVPREHTSNQSNDLYLVVKKYWTASPGLGITCSQSVRRSPRVGDVTTYIL